MEEEEEDDNNNNDDGRRVCKEEAEEEKEKEVFVNDKLIYDHDKKAPPGASPAGTSSAQQGTPQTRGTTAAKKIISYAFYFRVLHK